MRAMVRIPAFKLEEWRRVMRSGDRKDYDDLGYDGSVVFCWSSSFGDGTAFDLRVVTSLTDGEPPWCECVFLETGPDGCLHEVACTDVSDDLEGTWKATVGDVDYEVVVKGLS